MIEKIYVFYFEMESKIYIAGEILPAALAKALLLQHHPASGERFGVTTSRPPDKSQWGEKEIPVFNPLTQTWDLLEKKTMRYYSMKEACFYSGRNSNSDSHLLEMRSYVEKFPETEGDYLFAWADQLVNKEIVPNFKSSGNARLVLWSRLLAVREIASTLFRKWEDKADPFSYHVHTDTLGFQVRRILDEIAGLLFLEIFHPIMENGRPAHLDSFSLLLEDDDKKIKRKMKEIFKGYQEVPQFYCSLNILRGIFVGSNVAFIKAIQNINNAAKHSFYNSDFRALLGDDYPTVVALDRNRNSDRNELIEYNHSLSQIMLGFEDFLVDIAARVSDFRGKGNIDLTKPYLSDAHKIQNFDDIY